MEYLIDFIGYFIILCAVDVNRKEDSKIEIFSKEWVKMGLLVLIGGLLLSN